MGSNSQAGLDGAEDDITVFVTGFGVSIPPVSISPAISFLRAVLLCSFYFAEGELLANAGIAL
jgi:hypothetical protein